MSSRVLIVGGGVAGMEAAIALRELARDQVEVEMCSPRKDFVYRPFAVAEPYGSRMLTYDLRQLTARCEASFRLGTVGSIDSERQRARMHDGEELSYDHVIVACGTRLLAGVAGAVTFWGAAEDSRVQGVVRGLRERGLRRVAFTMPAGCNWALPLYELALLASSELSGAGVDGASLVVVTPEDTPLQSFGSRASERVAQLLAERGIEVVAAAQPVKFDGSLLTAAPSATIEADAVLSLPHMEGRQIDGVPHDLNGFVAVDGHGRVSGVQHAFAAGDVTSFPIKQGGISTQQADVAAEAIAAEIGCDLDPKPFEPVLRAVLWTGAEPMYLTRGNGQASPASNEPPGQVDARDKIIGRYLTPFLRGE